MRELIARQQNPQYGMIKVHMRVLREKIFLKTKNNPQKNKMIEQLRNGGAVIIESKEGWLFIDLFTKGNTAKLGSIFVDIEEDDNDVIEAKLLSFFKAKYKQAKFIVEVKEAKA